MKQAVLSLSGGMDSTTLLLRLLSQGYQVTALSFDYGQKHSVELERAEELIKYINSTMIAGNEVEHHIIDISSLSVLLDSSLISGKEDVPEGHYEDENMKKTVVPNRNKIFSSIIQSVALSMASKSKLPVKIAMGIHGGDHDVYPDCRQEFRDADYVAFLLGNWDAEQVQYYTPYLDIDKYGVLLDGEVSCTSLGLDFDQVYKRTNTSYKPILDLEFNEWYSDFRSASSVERVEAFIKLDRVDPVKYAEVIDGTIIIRDWDYVVTEVQRVLEKQ